MTTEDELHLMSDDELEQAFREARAQDESPETDIEEEEIVHDDVYEEEELDLEQPTDDEDSDNDLVTDEATTEEDEKESETEDDETDEDIAEEEEPTEETDTEEEDEVTEVQKYTFKANGKEYSFTPEEMQEQFPRIFGQAMDYTKKTQAMKPWRKTIDAIEQAKLGHDDINLMIDVLKGDKAAIAEVMKRTGVEALDLDTENSDYKPNDYGRDDTALAIKDVIEEISADKEYDVTHKILSKEWDERSFNEMTKDPELIRLLHIDVKSGMYDKVQPIAEKMKVFDRGRQTDLDYYKLAAQEYFKEQAEADRRIQATEERKAAREAKLAREAEINRVKSEQARKEATKATATKRKAAAPTKSKAGTQKTVTDYLDASDEDYEDWYQKNVLDKM